MLKINYSAIKQWSTTGYALMGHYCMPQVQWEAGRQKQNDLNTNKFTNDSIVYTLELRPIIVIRTR